MPDQLQPGLAQAGFGQYHVMTFRFSQSWDFTVMPAACHCQDRSLCLSHVCNSDGTLASELQYAVHWGELELTLI